MDVPEWDEDKLKAWRDAQQRYWEGLAGLSRFGPSAPGPLSAPAWSQGLEQWWAGVAPDAPPHAQDILKRILGMGKVYLGLAEQLYASTPDEATPANLESWMGSLERGFADWSRQLGQGKPATDGFGLSASLFEGWQQVVGSMPDMGAFREVGVGGLHLPNAGLWQSHLQGALHVPPFGPDADAKADLQALSALAMDYQAALDRYLGAFAKQGGESVQVLRQRVQQLAAKGQGLGSLRELYELWVDVSEQAYGEFVMGDAYQVLYADMVNALMALKRGTNGVLETRFRAAGLPTREDLQAVYRKQQALQRENRDLRQQLRSLAQRMAQLESGPSAGEGVHDAV